VRLPRCQRRIESGPQEHGGQTLGRGQIEHASHPDPIAGTRDDVCGIPTPAQILGRRFGQRSRLVGAGFNAKPLLVPLDRRR